jgi:hypothetical protein
MYLVRKLPAQENPNQIVAKATIRTIDTPAGTIAVDGWKFNFPSGLRSYFLERRGEEGDDFIICCKVLDKQGEIQLNLILKYEPARKSVEDAILSPEEGDMPVRTYEAYENGKFTGLFSGQLFPEATEGKEQEYDLVYTEEGLKAGKPNIKKTYQFKVNLYSNAEGAARKIISELDLGQETLLKISKTRSDYQNVCTAEMPKIYVLRDAETAPRGSNSDPRNNTISLSVDLFVDPWFKDEGLLNEGHELDHALLDSYYNGDADFEERLAAELRFGGHHSALAAVGFKAMAGYGPIRNGRELADFWESAGNPAHFNVYNEKKYFKDVPPGKDVRQGHPYDNSEEFFASCVLVMRNYPQEFIKNFQALPEEVKPLHVNLLNEVFISLDRIAISQERLKLFMPQIDELRKLAPPPK